eukprot:984923-Amphidinium_carterae.3
MAIPNISPDVTMSIDTNSSASKAVASRRGLNKKTKHVQLRYLYMQDIIQRGEMTITKIPTTDNPANVLTKHLPSTTITSHLDRLCLQTTMTSTVGSLLGVPTTTRLTIGMINPSSTQQQTPAAEARAPRLTQTQQYRRRRNAIGTPRATRQQKRLVQQPQQQHLAVQLLWHDSQSLATVRQFVADPIGAMADNGDFNIINGHIVEDTMSTLQQPRLKASSRAIPSTMEPTMRVTPTISSNPVSPPEERPTGQSSTTPMDTGANAEADGNGDVPMGAPSISSGSSSQCTVYTMTVMDIESMMRDSVVSPQCAPIVKQQLDASDYYPRNDQSSGDKLKTFAANTRAIDRDSFIPTNCDNDTTQYLWWSWFTDAQLKQFQSNGTVAGYTETRGDNVHKHHRFHNGPDHCLNLAIHCRWNSQGNDTYARNKPLHLMVWKQSIAHA